MNPKIVNHDARSKQSGPRHNLGAVQIDTCNLRTTENESKTSHQAPRFSVLQLYAANICSVFGGIQSSIITLQEPACSLRLTPCFAQCTSRNKPCSIDREIGRQLLLADLRFGLLSLPSEEIVRPAVSRVQLPVIESSCTFENCALNRDCGHTPACKKQ
jgi:hypothetical protein